MRKDNFMGNSGAPPSSGFNCGTNSGPWSRRERDIIAELAKGYIVKDIAQHLDLTVNTVKDYLKTIYSKAQVHSARELLLRHYGAPEAEGRDQRQRDLLTACERVMAAANAEKMMHALAEGARACAGAERAGLWRSGELRSRPVLIPLLAGAARFPGPCDFFAKVIERGTHQHRPESGGGQMLAANRRELAAMGLEGQVLGLALRLPANATLRAGLNLPHGPTLLLLSKPLAEGFSETELAACRLLAGLAAKYGPAGKAAMGAAGPG